MYYSSNELRSHQCQINFVFGERGNGKSYEGKKIMIKDFLNNGNQSVYIRRRETDIDNVKDNFFEDIKSEFEDCEFKVRGNYGYINDEIAIYFIALSTSMKRKSSPFPKVKTILFDEYIEPSFKKPNYIKNEMFILFELINTIVRKRNDWKLFLLGNLISFVNPFFTEFGIEIKDTEKRFHKFLKDEDDGNYLICVEITKTEEFKEEYKKTKFAKIIKNSDYCSYALGEGAFEDNNDFIKERKGTHIFVASFLYLGKEIGVWINDNNQYYIDFLTEKDSKRKFYIFNEDMREGYLNIRSKRSWVNREILQNYREGNVYYKNQECKKLMQEILRYI